MLAVLKMDIEEGLSQHKYIPGASKASQNFY